MTDINLQSAFVSRDEVAGPAALMRIELRPDARRWPSRLAVALRRAVRRVRKRSW